MEKFNIKGLVVEYVTVYTDIKWNFKFKEHFNRKSEEKFSKLQISKFNVKLDEQQLFKVTWQSFYCLVHCKKQRKFEIKLDSLSSGNLCPSSKISRTYPTEFPPHDRML